MLPQRRRTRLPEYDYRQNGAYFITVCAHDRAHLFGEIVNGTLHFPPQVAVGAAPCGGPEAPEQMLVDWLQKLAQKFSVTLDCYTVMPDHIHFVLQLAGEQTGSIPQMLDWYKTMTANAYIRGVKAGRYKPFAGHVWQRGYYEHVIRNETDLHDIRAYIENNPMKWELTKVQHTI